MTLRDVTTMSHFFCTIRSLLQGAGMLCTLLLDATDFLLLCLRPQAALAAENLFLRRQLALYQESRVTPRHAHHATRITLLWLSPWFDWPQALTVVQPETFKRWRRQGYRLFWPWTPCPGRPPIPVALQALIRQMARDNLTWGQRRIAHELRLTLGLRVSPRTVRKYLPTHRPCGPGQRATSQCWRTFLRHHAWDLIVRGVAADLTRGRPALGARIMQIVQGWWNRSVASRWRRTPPRDTTWLSWRSAPAWGLAVWSPVLVEVISVDQRSPPDGGRSYTPEPGLATRVPSVDRFNVCHTGAALCGWHRAGPHTRGGKPLSQGESWVLPWRRAA
jgi:hypothetical protein